MAHKHASLIVLLTSLLSTLTLVSCIPTNLRIQVNNENLSNAPYLLEAIRQIDNITQANNISAIQVVAGEPVSTSPAFVPIISSSTAAPVATSGASSQKPENRAEPANVSVPTISTPSLPSSNRSIEEDYEETAEPHNFSVIKEETIEELVDLDPETAPKLTPSTDTSGSGEAAAAGSDLANDYGKITDLASAETHSSVDGHESANSAAESGGSVAPKHDRKPQLPVTSSHLKKPAYGALNDELEASAGTNGDETATGGSGAKSLVSPTVLSDEMLPPNQPPKLNKKIPLNLPDTLEPSQVMNGVTNASAVPGIVNKEYGHQTRTRITLGGGYVRDRLPPLVNPASDAYVDNRPEKPVTSLEKPRPIVQPDSAGDKSEKREVDDDVPTSIGVDGSEKFVILDGAQNSTLFKPSGGTKQDPRCPKQGISTLEHPDACDKYYYCENGAITEYTCPNGLLYGTREIVLDFCVHRWKADCQDKSIPNPISSPGCRWQYGIFNVQGSPKCSPDYYECTAGKFEVKKCPVDGQVFDDRTKSCRYAEQVGCANQALADFHCPPDDQANTYWPFPRYFLNERALIHCVNDKPEIVRCIDSERVDPEHLHCVPIAKQQNAPVAVNLDTRKAREKKKKSVQ